MPARVLSNPWALPWEDPLPPLGLLPYDGWFSSALALHVQARPKACTTVKGPWSVRFTARDLLLCAGLAQSPAWSAFDRRAWGFLVEHGPSIEPRPGVLRIVDAAKTWDPRIRGVFAERLGLGMAVWLLWHKFGVVHIADAAPFVSKALVDPSSPFHGKQLDIVGTFGEQRPDFLCLTKSLEAVLAESKGALGPPSAISSAEKAKAKNQLKNVMPQGVKLRSTENRLAFASNFRLASEQSQSVASDSGVFVEDPPDGPRPLTFDASTDAIVIDAYAKMLNFLGLGWAAYLLRRGARPLLEPLDEEPENVTPVVRGTQVVILQQILGHRFGLPTRLATTLFNEPIAGVAERVAAVLAESALVQPAAEEQALGPGEGEDLFILPNGFVGIPL